MCRACSLIGGLVMVLTLAGCSESPPESGPVPYKATPSSPALDGFAKQVGEQAKKGVPPNKKEESPKPASESKPAADATKGEEKKKD